MNLRARRTWPFGSRSSSTVETEESESLEVSRSFSRRLFAILGECEYHADHCSTVVTHRVCLSLTRGRTDDNREIRQTRQTSGSLMLCVYVIRRLGRVGAVNASRLVTAGKGAEAIRLAVCIGVRKITVDVCFAHCEKLTRECTRRTGDTPATSLHNRQSSAESNRSRAYDRQCGSYGKLSARRSYGKLSAR